jgi:ABC-2 type transport system permease protein
MGTFRLIRAKLQATTILSGGVIRDLARKDQLWVLPLALLGIVVGVGTAGFFLFSNYQAFYLLGVQTGRPELLFSLALLVSWVLAFFLGIPVVVSVFFFSRDTAMLLPLPLRARSIVLADAFLVYLSSLGLHAVLTVPALVVYAMHAPVGAWYVVAGLLYLVGGPLVPLGLSVLLAFALTSLVNLSRYRIALEVAGFVLVLAGVVGLQLVMQRSMMGQLTGSSAVPAAMASSLVSIPDTFAPLAWAAAGFVPGSGVVPLAGFVLFSVAVAAGALAMAGRYFLRLTVERAATRASRLSAARYQALRAPRSVIRALLSREIAVLATSSAFLFEGIMEGLVFPMVLGLFSLTLPPAAKALFSGFIASSPWAGLAVFALLALMCGINTVSSTSLSREGKAFALSLVLPVSGRTHVRAKLLFHLAIFGTGYVIDLALLVGLLHVPPVSLVYLVPGGVGFLLLTFSASIFLDLRRPYLSWTHPQQAMKQNGNAMAAMGLAVLVVGAHAAVAAGLWALGAGPVGVGVAVAALSLVGSAAALPAVERYADRRYGGELEAAASSG